MFKNTIFTGAYVVSTVDSLGPENVQTRGQDHTQVYSYAEQNEGTRHKGE